MKVLVCAVLVAFAVVLGAQPASADVDAAPASYLLESSVSSASHDEWVIEQLIQSADRETNVFSADRALRVGVDAQTVADFSGVVEAMGWMVDGEVGDERLLSESASVVAAKAAACTGQRGYTGFWGYMWQWAFNSCDTELIQSALLAGGAVVGTIAGIFAAVPGAAPAAAVTAAVAGVIAVGAPVLEVCQKASYNYNAVYFNLMVYGSAGCWAQ